MPRYGFGIVTGTGGMGGTCSASTSSGTVGSATPTGGNTPLSWAAAHLWTVRDGRITGWEAHMDLAAARETLDA